MNRADVISQLCQRLTQLGPLEPDHRALIDAAVTCLYWQADVIGEAERHASRPVPTALQLYFEKDTA